jgi:hypothetical protein
MAIVALSFLFGHCNANLQLLSDIFSGRFGNQNGAAGLPANSNGFTGLGQQLDNAINGGGGVGAGGIGAGGIPGIGGAGGVGVPNNGQFGNGRGQGNNFGRRK